MPSSRPFHLVYQVLQKGKRPFVVKIDPRETVSSLANKIWKQQSLCNVGAAASIAATSSSSSSPSSFSSEQPLQLFRVTGKLEETKEKDSFVYQNETPLVMDQLPEQVFPQCRPMDPQKSVGDYYNGVLPHDRIHLLVCDDAMTAAQNSTQSATQTPSK